MVARGGSVGTSVLQTAIPSRLRRGGLGERNASAQDIPAAKAKASRAQVEKSWRGGLLFGSFREYDPKIRNRAFRGPQGRAIARSTPFDA